MHRRRRHHPHRLGRVAYHLLISPIWLALFLVLWLWEILDTLLWAARETSRRLDWRR